jgi:PAS domain S-box-containing protein
MNNCIPKNGLSTTRFTSGVWKMHCIIFLIGLFIICIVSYGFYAGDRISTVDASLVRSAMKLNLEAATTNLVIEGLLGEGFAANFEPVWAPLDAALRNFLSIVTESKIRWAVLPFRSTALDAANIKSLEQKLSAYKEKAAERFANKRISFLDEEADRVYRLAFKDLVKDLDALEDRLRGVMSGNLTLFRYSQAAMILLCILLTALAAILFQRFAGQRARAYVSLQTANEQLENEIVERRRSENAVRASEERFRQLAENIMDVFWLEDVGEAHKIVYVSPTFELWWGCKSAEVYADSSIFWQIVHPDDRKLVTLSYQKFTGGTGEFNTEFRIIRPDGSIRWVHSRGFPIRDAAGKMHRIAGLAQDITGQKREEERREQLAKELKDFSNAVSHDLRAPLINLKGFSKEIEAALEVIRPVIDEALAATGGSTRKEVATAFYEDLPEAVEFISASVSKMERLINAILKLSRLERRELLLEKLDMNKIVQDTLKSFAYQIKEIGAIISVKNMPETIADKVSIEQVFSNLLGNALNYLDSERAGKIEISAESWIDETVFHVRDNGRGIKNSDLTNIFNVFERLGNDSVAGEGMGLSYVQALVRRHEGNVFCVSEYGVGTKFTFTISKRLNLHENSKAD